MSSNEVERPSSDSNHEVQSKADQKTNRSIWSLIKNPVTHLFILSLAITYLYRNNIDTFVLVLQGLSILLLIFTVFFLIQLISRFFRLDKRALFNSSLNEELKGLLRSNSSLLYISTTFYIGLLFIVITTGWIIRNEWAILGAAVAPLVIHLLLQLIPNLRRSRLTEFEAGVSGIKLKFDMSQGGSLPTASILKLSRDEMSMIRKGEVKEIKLIIEKLRQAGKSPRVLEIPLTPNTSTRDTSEYIRAISDSFPTFRYLVFVEDSTDKYKGFMKADDFDIRYPLPEFDILFGIRKENVQWFQDQFDTLAEKDGDIARFLSILSEMKELSDNAEARRRIKQAIQSRRTSRLTEDSLKYLNADIPPLKEPTVLEAFISLRDAGSGLPLVDSDDRFIGIVEYEDILSYLLRQTG